MISSGALCRKKSISKTFHAKIPFAGSVETLGFLELKVSLALSFPKKVLLLPLKSCAFQDASKPFGKRLNPKPSNQAAFLQSSFAIKARRESRRKGQDPFVSHTVSFILSMFVLLIIVSSLNTLSNNYKDFIGRNEIQQVCAIVKSGVEKIYSPDNYTSPTNTTKGRVVLNLPEKVVDTPYSIRFVNVTANIETTSGFSLNDTCRIGFNVSYEGRTTGGLTEIIWTAYDNGTSVIKIGRI